jgi:hypothetical protein
MHMTTARVAFSLLAVVCSCAAQSSSIADAEAFYPPTSARLAAIHSAAQRDGWAPQTAQLRQAALRAYEKEKTVAAEAWLNVYRWAALFGRQEGEFTSRWMEAVQSAKVGHANMPTRYELRSRSLGAGDGPRQQAGVVGERGVCGAVL